MAGSAVLIGRDQVSHRSMIVGVMVLFVAAFALRYAGAASHIVHQDEFYTFFAARSWVRGGTLAIGAGEYVRAAIYSKLTALSLRVLGETMLAVRMPAIIAGALTVPALFAFLRRDGGAVAAWVAGALLCFDLLHVDTSQLARFYALQALAVFGAAVASYRLLVGQPSRHGAIGWAVIGIASLWLAMKIQETTVIAAIGLATFAVGIVVRDMVYGGGHRWLTPRRALWLVAGGIVLLLASLAVRPVRDVLEAALTEYRMAAPWAEEHSREWLFYHGRLMARFRWLWLLTPVAAVVAWWRSPSLAMLGIAMLAVPLGLHSFAGMKHPRYILYVIPFLCLLWGLAVAEVARIAGIVAERRWPARWARLAVPGVVMLFLAMVAVTVPDYRQEGMALWRLHRTGFAQEADVRAGAAQDWTPFLPVLRRVSDVPVLVVPDDLRSLYHLGGFDLLLSYTLQKDFDVPEFGRDPRTGAPTFSSAASVARLVRCYPRGVFLIERHRWRTYDIRDDAADMIERITTRLALPPAVPFLAFGWRHGVDASPGCVALRQQVGEKPRALPRLVEEAGA